VHSEDSENFSGHPYIGRIARSSLWLLCCLVMKMPLPVPELPPPVGMAYPFTQEKSPLHYTHYRSQFSYFRWVPELPHFTLW